MLHVEGEVAKEDTKVQLLIQSLLFHNSPRLLKMTFSWLASSAQTHSTQTTWESHTGHLFSCPSLLCGVMIIACQDQMVECQKHGSYWGWGGVYVGLFAL